MVGCGHAHIFVLEKLATLTDIEPNVLLITPDKQLYYSGILPSVLAGHIDLDSLSLDITPLIKNANIDAIFDTVIAINANQKQLTTQQHGHLSYDWLFINTGAQPKYLDNQPAHKNIIGVKPIADFLPFWHTLQHDYQSLTKNQLTNNQTIAIIGGGAAAIEMAFTTKYSMPKATVMLISERLLAHQPEKMQQVIKKQLKKMTIVHVPKRIKQINPLSDEQIQLIFATDQKQSISDKSVSHKKPVTHVMLAMGNQAPIWLDDISKNDIAKSDDGYILVNHLHQSISHPHVFATGDVASRADIHLPKSGVYAVRAGEILAENMLKIISQNTNSANLSPYTPKKQVLQILALGEKNALAVYGNHLFLGKWVWYWKRWIDLKFVRRFQKKGNH